MAPNYQNSVQSVSPGAGIRTRRLRPKMQERTSRPSIDEYFTSLAKMVATRSTCMHRNQGVVLIRDGHILSTGYNGSPPKQPHCTELRYCLKDKFGECRAEGLHGESNAVAWAARHGISVSGATAYCVYSPCRSCCNLLKSAGITEVKYLEVYDGFLEGPDYLDRTLYIKTSKVKMIDGKADE